MRRFAAPENYRQWMRMVERRLRQIEARTGESVGGSLLGGPAPVGEVAYYAATPAPQGWLPCDGTTRDRTTYGGLFQVIGTTFNTGGEASSDFRLPSVSAPAGLLAIIRA